MQFNLSSLDLIVIFGYLIGITALGTWFGRYVKNQGEFFVASKKLPWWVCSMAFVTVLISAHDIVTYSQTGYVKGFAAYQMYLDDLGWAVLFLAVGIPIYYLSGIFSVPEYLEKRYNSTVRYVSSVAQLLFLLALMSFNFYAVGVIMNAILGWNVLTGMMLSALLTSIYTAAGGIMAVMITDTIQAVLIWAGGLYVLIAGIVKAGGWSTMLANLPPAHRSLFTPMLDKDFPQLGMFLAGAVAITGAWYFAHQGNMQKILAARTINQARIVTIIFMGILMPMGVFFTGTPGIILRSMVEAGTIAPVQDSSASFLMLVSMVAKPGFLGLIMAFVLSAMMSTGDTYINSSATIFVNDLYMPWKPHREDRHYVKVARYASLFIGIVIPFLYAAYFMKFEYLQTALFSLTPAVMPGMIIVVLGGMLTTKISSKTAALTIAASIIGVALSIVMPKIFFEPFTFGTNNGWFTSWIGFIWAIAGLVIGSIIYKADKSDEELLGLVYTLQPVSMLEKFYWTAVAKGKKGYIELTNAELLQIKKEFEAEQARASQKATLGSNAQV